MEIYPPVQKMILEQPAMSAWEHAHVLLSEAAQSHPSLWRFPVVTCKAVGGVEAQALPGAAAIASAHLAIHLIDDLLDEDPAGEQHRLGVGETANLASAFQAAGLAVLGNSSVPAAAIQNAQAALSRALLRTAWGQAQDAANPWNESAYWQVAEDRSAPLFAAAFEIGAWMGGASAAMAQQLSQLGGQYGIMIQMSDDLGDALAVPAGSDWLQGRASLPLLYAGTVNHPERERFLALRSQAADPACLQEAQAILVRCGAVGYCLDRLLHHSQLALRELDRISLPAGEEIQGLFMDLVRPTLVILSAVGLPVNG